MELSSLKNKNFRKKLPSQKNKKNTDKISYMGKRNFLATNLKSSYISGGNWQCLKIKQKNLLQRDFFVSYYVFNLYCGKA